MIKYATFLRGINIGGNNIIKMSDLKNVLIDNNFNNIKTYINSGNLVFSHEYEKTEVKEVIKEIIKFHFKLTIEVFVKTAKEIEQIITDTPFSNSENDNSKKVVILLSDKIDINKALHFKNDKRIEENYYCSSDLMYIYYHKGIGRSKFTTSYIEKKLNVISTGRNWNTILKISEMLKEL